MKTAYRAANGIEAHMLQDLLAQDGIAARLDGAYLEGAIGELPAAGLVRLVVEDEDYDRARALLMEWEASNAPAPAPPTPRTTPAGKSRIGAALIGLAVGVAGATFYFRAPVGNGGIDFDGDGVLDETWTYSPQGVLTEVRTDRNRDRKVDLIIRYAGNGAPEVSESDEDFNGTFESISAFVQGNIQSTETDTDGDGVADLKTYFRHGVATEMVYLDKYTGLPLRVETLRLGRIVHADIDFDRDGKLDRRVTYSAAGEEEGFEVLRPAN